MYIASLCILKSKWSQWKNSNHIQQNPVKRLQLNIIQTEYQWMLGLIISNFNMPRSQEFLPIPETTEHCCRRWWALAWGGLVDRPGKIDEDWFLSKNIRKFISNYANIFVSIVFSIIFLWELQCWNVLHVSRKWPPTLLVAPVRSISITKGQGKSGTWLLGWMGRHGSIHLIWAFGYLIFWQHLRGPMACRRAFSMPA